ncbi:spinster family MFS transporter [Citrifermentans pelophilum]|nr:MFS transporter [Geoanaerobacter pelophilus]
MTLKEPISGRRVVLAMLLAVNLLNYIDRQVLYAVFPLVKGDLRLSDTSLGLLGSAFMLSYMVAAPLFGWIGDRKNRVHLAAGGLVVWSLATAGGGLARSYAALLAARSVVGIGEASFGTVSPGLISDYFPQERRGRALAYFYLAIPVGSALGYLVGGIVGQRYGWQSAFLLAGIPGLLLTIPLWRLKDPARIRNSASIAAPRGSYRLFLQNRSFITATLAMAAMTFALGGLAQWTPSFLNRMHGLDVAKGNTIFGAMTVVSGILGTLSGGWLGDRMQARSPSGYLMVSGWGFVLGAPVLALAISSGDLTTCLAAIFVAETLLFLNTGPLNTVIVNVSPASSRAMAFAINIFAIHALGDAVSPAIIGMFSDAFGLRSAMLITPVAIAVAAFFCFLCCRWIAGDAERSGDQSLPCS